jgi:cyclopropane fatty-acyl-phospholipid synthase-like methyltransferase
MPCKRRSSGKGKEENPEHGGWCELLYQNAKLSGDTEEEQTMDQQEQTQFFYEIFDPSLPRLGPGDDASTRKALNALLSAKLRRTDASDSTRMRILDIGCGNGAQTIQLAKHADGVITAVDNHQPFLDELQRRAEAEGLSQNIRLCLRDMRALEMEMEKGAFDLIWSEGSLFIMGFREGLQAFRDLLTPGGLLAASELSWLRSDPPPECREYFAKEYPVMVEIAANLATITSCGYEILGHFTLPESAWWLSFYHPLEERLQSLREEYATDCERMEVIESFQTEIETYRRYSTYYGNVFYLMRRSEAWVAR